MLTFCATATQGDRLDSATLVPLMSKPLKLMVVPNNVPTTIQQNSNKTPTRIANNDSPLPTVLNDFEEILTTCKTNYGISKQGKKDTRVPILASNTSYKDTNDWSSECDELF
jgi:hypothetical protein